MTIREPETLDEVIGYSLSQLSERSATNYRQVILLVEKYFQKPLYELNDFDAKVLKKNMEQHGNFLPEGKTLSETTRHFYLRVLISTGRKMEDIINHNAHIRNEYYQRFGENYHSPFSVLDDKVQFHHVVGKKEYAFPKKEEIELFLEKVFLGEEKTKRPEVKKLECQETLLVALLFYCGVAPRTICKMKFSDFTFRNQLVFLRQKEKGKENEMALHPVAVSYLTDYMLYLMQSGNYQREDYVFRNRNKNPINLKNISSILLHYSRKAKSESGITTGVLNLIAKARKYEKALGKNRPKAYEMLTEEELEYYSRQIMTERKEKEILPENKIYLRALEYVMEEPDRIWEQETSGNAERKLLERMLDEKK